MGISVVLDAPSDPMNHDTCIQLEHCENPERAVIVEFGHEQMITYIESFQHPIKGGLIRFQPQGTEKQPWVLIVVFTDDLEERDYVIDIIEKQDTAGIPWVAVGDFGVRDAVTRGQLLDKIYSANPRCLTYPLYATDVHRTPLDGTHVSKEHAQFRDGAHSIYHITGLEPRHEIFTSQRCFNLVHGTTARTPVALVAELRGACKTEGHSFPIYVDLEYDSA